MAALWWGEIVPIPQNSYVFCVLFWKDSQSIPVKWSQEREKQWLGLNHGQTDVIEAEDCERKIILILCSANSFAFFYVGVIEVI